MSDVLYHGRRFRTFSVLDDGVREAIDDVVDTSIPSGHVVRPLEQIKACRGEVLDACLFDNLGQVRQMTAELLRSYDGGRPHDALGDKTLAAYRDELPPFADPLIPGYDRALDYGIRGTSCRAAGEPQISRRDWITRVT